MLVITGGAGFIGSAIAQELNSRGRADFIIVDDIDHPEKDKNIVSIKYQKLFGKIMRKISENQEIYFIHGSMTTGGLQPI